MKQWLGTLILLLSISLTGATQEAAENSNGTKDIDPLSLQVLKAATEPIHQAKAFSFRALVSREHLGTNGQIITLFHLSRFTLQRPDKLHVDFFGPGAEVQLFYNAGASYLFSPGKQLYTAVKTPNSIDKMLDDLREKNVFIPVENFLLSDPYESLTKGLLTGYVIGKVTLFGQPVHQLAFTDASSEWQLWVVGGSKPVIRRLEIIDKTQPEHPRTIVDFLDWNLNATPAPALFKFSKPPNAKEIELLKEIQSE